jgi:hypothetical protein
MGKKNALECYDTFDNKVSFIAALDEKKSILLLKKPPSSAWNEITASYGVSTINFNDVLNMGDFQLTIKYNINRKDLSFEGYNPNLSSLGAASPKGKCKLVSIEVPENKI